jgi:tryptophan-rich sensory protein
VTDILSLFVFLVLVFVAAGSGAVFSPGEWYRSLNRPSWTPPDWAFPVVWSILYVMIAVAGWFVWKAEGLGLAMAIWGANLVVNAAWSWIMFGMRQIGLALADVALLWLLTAAFIFAATSVDIRASWLFVPYLVWVTIASALNFEVWRRNPAARAAQ